MSTRPQNMVPGTCLRSGNLSPALLPARTCARLILVHMYSGQALLVVHASAWNLLRDYLRHGNLSPSFITPPQNFSPPNNAFILQFSPKMHKVILLLLLLINNLT